MRCAVGDPSRHRQPRVRPSRTPLHNLPRRPVSLTARPAATPAAVLADDVLPAAKDWLLESTPSEREYFKHLLTLLDQNYEDWVALQHKNFKDFLERTQEQTIDNVRFLGKFLETVFQILCCLRVRKNKVNQFNAQADAEKSKEAAPAPKKGRFGFLGFGRKAVATVEVRKKEAPKGSIAADDEEDDLVEAYLRARTQQQERALAEAESRNSQVQARPMNFGR